ncbi:MAG: hypothetical protein HY893_06090 [Deltaproteobacteria bacterium]|nr:hypothetical protein [Deltaproteobacteria bacterium]
MRVKSAAFLTQLILVYIFTSASTFSGEAPKKGFTSPSGRIEAVFTVTRERKPGKEGRLSTDSARRISYRVDFFSNSRYLASAVLDNDKNLAPQSVFRSFRWSPKDDFVMLPAEGWHAPGTPAVRAVSLNPELKWKEARLGLDNIVWTDPLTAVGDYHNNCDYGVSRFDGTLGVTTPVMASESPIGYELISVNGDIARIRQVLDNCRLSEGQSPLCFDYDLKTRKKTPASCPAQTKKPKTMR